jgi:hypothetical protein
VSITQLVMTLRLDIEQLPPLERALAALRAKGLAENVGVDSWRRSA